MIKIKITVANEPINDRHNQYIYATRQFVETPTLKKNRIANTQAVLNFLRTQQPHLRF